MTVTDSDYNRVIAAVSPAQIASPLFGEPIGPWHKWFAWRPVRTYDGRIVWGRYVLRRRIQKKLHLHRGLEQWWQYLAILALPLLLGTCSLAPGYSQYKTVASGVVDQTILDRMEYNDKKAEVIRALNCDISLGAYGRMPDGDVKRGVGLICGVNAAAANDDLVTALELLRTVQGVAPPP